MTDLDARSPVRYDIEAKIIRADGTVEDLGTIGSTAWGRFSRARLRAWLRIKHANWRNRHRLKED